MSVSVGNFPGLAGLNRRAIPGPKNPMDKSTIVSIYPREVNETKETIFPGQFYLPPGSYENPKLLVIGSSSWWREIDEEQPLLEIPCSSIQIADSVVRDYCNGILGCDMSEAMPGLFFIPGQINLNQLLSKEFRPLLDRAHQKQKNWYNELVKMADSLWARSNGNPLAISAIMRMAAQELGLNRDWLRETENVKMERCPACGAMKNPEFPVCGNCHTVVDVEKFNKLGLKVAEK